MDNRENGLLEGLKTGAALGGIFLLVCFGTGIWNCMCDTCENTMKIGGGCVFCRGVVDYIIDDWRFIFIFLGIVLVSGVIGFLSGACSEKQEKRNDLNGRSNNIKANDEVERDLFYRENVHDYYEKLRKRDLDIMPSKLVKNATVNLSETYVFNYSVDIDNSVLFNDNIFNEKIKDFDNYWRCICQMEYEYYTILVQKTKY